MRKQQFCLALFPLFCALVLAQQPTSDEQSSDRVERMAHTPVYRVNVVSRTTESVDYRHHSGATTLDFRGTDLMPRADGHAKVESRTGRIEIDADFDQLQSSRTLGPEYLTYVLWAITPEGRPVNLGEVVPHDKKSSLKVSTDLQAFGLIVTAEPYFAVTRPSNLVVLENVVKKDTKGWAEPIHARFDAIERGQYTIDVNPAELPATRALDTKTPTDLLEARNAVYIARAEGAERYAPDALDRAEDFLARGEDYFKHKQPSKTIATVARDAAQAAEDARVLSIRARQEEQQAAERQAMEERTQKARSEAEQAKQEQARAQAEGDFEARQREEAEQERLAAQQSKAQAEEARRQAEAERSAAEAQQQAAQAQAQQAQSAAQQAEQARFEAERDKEQTRARLLQQLNQVLETKESARGLIVDMPDVLFDFGKYTLKPGARERLAKVAGILLAYPDLHVQVEGHTDNIGSDSFNQTLSEQRANTVRDFLVSQGVKPNDIDAHGFGKGQPVASNDTASGRQLNRRVDLVVSGSAIGNTKAPNGAAPAAIETAPGSSVQAEPSPSGQMPVNGAPRSAPATPPPSSAIPH
jgi:outer membrane protein OmpA-like peptidoglycan-associated protein